MIEASPRLSHSGSQVAHARMFLFASADASGQFAIQLGPGSALSDGPGFPVAFDFTPGTITINGTVVPLPTPGLLGGFGLMGVMTRRRRGGRQR